jgi:hypothetical protein
MATPPPTNDSSLESIRIGAGHPQYVAVLNKRFNKRFTAGPDSGPRLQPGTSWPRRFKKQ